MARKRNSKSKIVISINNVEKELDRPENGLKVVLLIVFIALVMVGFVWQKVKVAQLLAETKKLENQFEYYKEKNEKLNGQILELENETRIINTAKEVLNMYDAPVEAVTIRNNKN